MISYEPLFETLAKKNLSLNELARKMKESSGISLINNVSKGKYIRTDSLENVCKVLDCDISNILKWQQGQQEEIEKENQLSKEMYYVKWDLLSDFLKKNGDSFRSASLKMNKNQNYLICYATKKKEMRLKTLKKICDFFNLNYKDFITNEPIIKKASDTRYKIDWDKLKEIIKSKGDSLRNLSLQIGKSASFLGTSAFQNSCLLKDSVDNISNQLKINKEEFATEITE